MSYEKIFMVIIALLEALASPAYLWVGDWRRAGVWMAYAIATLLITF